MVKQAVSRHIIGILSSPLILGMQLLVGTIPTIRWLEYEIDVQYGQSVVTLKGWAEKRQLPRVELYSAKTGIKAICKGG